MEYKLGELDEVSLAYAITVHKSQGSEYAAVVIPLAVQHYPLLQRNLLYTAVTRGRTLVVIVGEPKALAMAVKSVRSTRRLTNLTARLARGAGAGAVLPAALAAGAQEHPAHNPRRKDSPNLAGEDRFLGTCHTSLD